LGAVPEANSFVIYFKNNFLKNAAILYKKWIFKPEKYVVRNPFKE
jgi:hypothetical protein